LAKARPVAGLHPHASLTRNARAIVAVRVAEMFGFAHAIGDPVQDKDLHNMRIAAKRLRYTLEMFRPALTDDGPRLIDVVKEVQERIGAIHDADVLDGIARQRLAVTAQQHVTALAATAAAGGAEEERVSAVRACATRTDDATVGLAVLLARTRAGRDRDFDALTGWWALHGGQPLRDRLDACVAS